MNWPTIKKNALIDIIAPSGKIDAENVSSIRQYIENLGLRVRIPENLLGDHPFCANKDEIRFEHLKNALYAEDSDLIWCVRGGHGTTKIVSQLMDLPKPKKQKLLVGFSDITTLHLFLNQVWQWPSLHGPMARQVACLPCDERDVQALHKLWFDGLSGYVSTELQPVNELAKNTKKIIGETVGTCLSLLQTSLNTPWQVVGKNKILILEDINEQAYRLDRMLTHLTNANIFHEAKAIIFGDFGEDFSEAQNNEIDFVLHDFSERYLILHGMHVPVFRIQGMGHGKRNQPVPLGVHAVLCGEKRVLEFSAS